VTGEADTPRRPASIREVVEAGLCIGCGLCEGVAPGRWRMVESHGRLRPAPVKPEDHAADAEILAACPGAHCEAEAEAGAEVDPVWGAYRDMSEAWAGESDVRFRAATGGVLTALGRHLLRSGAAKFILHVRADPVRPMRSVWCLSETPEAVLAATGSRYGPAAPLAGLEAALARREPFAVIAKPCDIGAVRLRARDDPRLDRWLVAALAMVCGGASELGKSEAVLDAHGIREEDVTLFRYRGHGNPGPTRVETRDGRAVELSYLDMWGDEGQWRIQTRCKLCPDAIGEAADIAAADIWPGGQPTGEDEGFNGMIVRTERGAALAEAAAAAGDLVRGRGHGPRDYDDFQPHQVRKKKALAARLRGLSEAGAPVYTHRGLRLDELDSKDEAEQRGTAGRVRSGRFSEALPKRGRRD